MPVAPPRGGARGLRVRRRPPAALALPVLLSACAPGSPPEAAGQAPPDHFACAVAAPAGEAARGGAAHAGAAVAVERLEGEEVRVRVLSDGAPLSAFVVALAAAMETPAVVSPEVADRAVTMALPSATPAETLRALSEAVEVYGWMEAGVLGLDDQSPQAAADPSPPGPPAELSTDDPARARAAAGLFCAMLGGPGDAAGAAGSAAFATSGDAAALEQWRGLEGFLSAVEVGDGEVFGCRGAAEVAPPRLERADPDAPLAVEVVESPEGLADDAARLSSILLSVDARGAPLGAVALSISEAIGVGVVIDERAAQIPVTLQVQRASAETIWRSLARSLDLEASLDTPALLFDPARSRPRRGPEREGLVVRAWPVEDPGRARALAELYCAGVISSRGRAAAVEGALFAIDTVDRLSWLNEAL